MDFVKLYVVVVQYSPSRKFPAGTANTDEQT